MEIIRIILPLVLVSLLVIYFIKSKDKKTENHSVQEREEEKEANHMS